MGRVTACSCPSVASLKNSWWCAPEKPYSTGTPGTTRCHQPALRGGQEGNGRLGKQWRGRVTPETKGTGGHSSDRQSGLWLLPKDSSQPCPRQEKTPATPWRSPSRHGGRASEQGDGTPAAGSVDKVGEYTAAQGHLDKHLTGRFPPGPFPGTSCLRCPAKPVNLHVWGKSETPSCLLCFRRGSLEYLLSSCPKALADGRYRWRHDQVLKTSDHAGTHGALVWRISIC